MNVGPDDEGRFAWERASSLRIDTKAGVQDVKSSGFPLGFDLRGRVIVFVQPPLVRPHVPLTKMPPARGTLHDTRCSLVRRVST